MPRVIDKIFRTLLHAPLLWWALRRQGPAGADRRHVEAAVAWLLASQEAGGNGGYAHSFHLLYAWQPSYPETTGYIIPSLHRAHLAYGLPGVLESVAAATRWLTSIQQEDGGFGDLEGHPQVFDTGQILIGLNYLAEQAPELSAPQALARAARWLVSVQEEDGSFRRHAYNGIPHSYYSRVGAALVTAGRLLNDDAVAEAGLRNLRWTMAQQGDNGFFAHASFDANPAYLHTMVYILEGLLDGYQETDAPELLDATVRFASRLLETAKRDGVLRSQYHPDYRVANDELCMTGLAQWAGVCFRLARLLNDGAYRESGVRTLEELKRRQIFCGNSRLHGGLLGSTPFNGRYMTAAIPNWGLKFFIDAFLEKQ
jgi:hypothetical protein